MCLGLLVRPGLVMLRPALAGCLSRAVAFNRGLRRGGLRQLALEHVLYILEKFHLLGAHQGDCLARQSGAAGAADAVHVIFRGVRQLVVDHERQLFDVEPSGSNVRRDQYWHLALLEFFERLHALDLGAVAVYFLCGDSILLELAREAICVSLHPHEHQHLPHVARTNETNQQRSLL